MASTRVGAIPRIRPLAPARDATTSARARALRDLCGITLTGRSPLAVQRRWRRRTPTRAWARQAAALQREVRDVRRLVRAAAVVTSGSCDLAPDEQPARRSRGASPCRRRDRDGSDVVPRGFGWRASRLTPADPSSGYVGRPDNLGEASAGNASAARRSLPHRRAFAQRALRYWPQAVLVCACTLVITRSGSVSSGRGGSPRLQNLKYDCIAQGRALTR